MKLFRSGLVILALALTAAPLLAQDKADHDKAARDGSDHAQHAGGQNVLKLLPPDAITQHTLETPSGALNYTATAGTLSIFDQSGERKASIFYTAYVKRDGEANRPVTFVFNGGPGAASAYLHLGLVGPKIADFGPDRRDGAAATLRDNPNSWLTFTDLVMIDPIGTGWSRTAKPDDAKAYYNVRSDAELMAKAVALYVAHNGRSASPKYLLGESYGGLRSAKVARVLQEDQGTVVAGIVMISPLLEGSFLFGGDKFSLGCALQLPSIAAAEMESKKTFTPQALADAEHFAMGEYLTTLAGPRPTGERATDFYGRIAQMSGLPLDLVTQNRGCIRSAYLNRRHEANGLGLSAYDATFAAPDPFPENASRNSDDPILDGFTRALGGLFVGYARETLGFKTDMTYNLLAADVNGQWEWTRGHGRASPPGASDDLRELLALNPSFHLLIGHGYTDMVIPYGVDRYVLDHLPPMGAPDRAQLKLYSGGHMFYFGEPSRVAFTNDVKRFYEGSAKGN